MVRKAMRKFEIRVAFFFKLSIPIAVIKKIRKETKGKKEEDPFALNQ